MRTRPVLIALLAPSTVLAALAQQPAVPVNTYAGYAHADCTSGNSVVRIVLPAGKVPIPAALPPTPPRPAVELLVHAPLDRALGQTIAVVQAAPAGAELAVVASSCPVVGSCSRAQTGTVSFQRRADDGALTGEFRIRWPDEPARATDVIGKFVAVWRDSGAKCP